MGEDDMKILGHIFKNNENASLKYKAIRGSVQTVSGYGLTQLLRLVSNVALARLLFPEAFGLMTLVMLFMQGLAMFSDIGILPSIIQNKRGNDRIFLDTAWTVQIVRGLMLWLIASLCAVPFSIAYDQPMLADLIPWASLSALIAGFNSTKLATENRHLNLGKLTVIDIVSQIMAIIVMCLWAFLSPEVWALVAGGLSGTITKLLLSHFWLEGRRNKLLLNSCALRSIFSFGKWIFISTLLHFLAGQSDKLIFGKLITIEALGVYSIAVILANAPFHAISQLSSKIIFPYFCKVRQQAGISPKIYGLVSYLYTYIGTLVALLTYIGGPLIIQSLYDERYHGAMDLVQLIVIGKWFEVVLGNLRGAALLAYSKAHWNSIGSAVKLVVIGFFVIPAFRQYGFHAAVLVYALAECGRYMVFVYANQLVDVRGASREALTTLLAFSVIGSVEWFVSFLVSSGLQENYVRLIICAGFSLLWIVILFGLYKFYQRREDKIWV
jgi:O-antigen/teichoic acid export membrane protein|tara:strand:+ start:554 stop:2041 length:1488 start_codon:yes stop_codon:yes gene_type:complete